MGNLKKFQLKRQRLNSCTGGAGPFDLGATDTSLSLVDGSYTKSTYSQGACVGGGTTEIHDREWYNSAGDMTSSKTVVIHNGGL